MERIPVLRMGALLLVTIQVDMHDRLALVLQDDLTTMIARTGARGVLIDISALDVVDSFIGRMLANTAAMARVLDAAVEHFAGRAAPRRLITMRLDAHMIDAGATPRMPQHASLISGTSAAASISGNSTSPEPVASMAIPCSANSRAYPDRACASLSPGSPRPATATTKPASESHLRPSIALSNAPRPRSAS